MSVPANTNKTPFDEWLPTVEYVPVPLAAAIYEYLSGRKISTSRIYRRIREGAISAMRPNGGPMLVRVADMERHIMYPCYCRQYIREHIIKPKLKALREQRAREAIKRAAS